MVPAGAAMAAIIATRPRGQYDSDKDGRINIIQMQMT